MTSRDFRRRANSRENHLFPLQQTILSQFKRGSNAHFEDAKSPPKLIRMIAAQKLLHCQYHPCHNFLQGSKGFDASKDVYLTSLNGETEPFSYDTGPLVYDQVYNVSLTAVNQDGEEGKKRREQ